MEMLSQLPVPKASINPSGSGKPNKTKHEDVFETEAVSFPTLLQGNQKIQGIGSGHQSLSETGKEGTQPLLGMIVLPEIQGSAALPKTLPVENPEAAKEMTIGALIPAEVEAEADLSKIAMATSPGGKVVPTATPLAAESSSTGSAEISTTPVQEVVSTETGQLPSSENSQILPSAQVSAQGNIGDSVESKPEHKSVHPQIKTEGVEAKPTDAPTSFKTATKEENLEISKNEIQLKSQEKQPALVSTENTTVEVIKDTPVPEQSNAPVVENPALTRLASSELDFLTAQANAQKNYQQPTAVADQGAIAKPTLSDLDLSSGSFESSEQKEQSITRILSALNEPATPLKRSIRGQVLNRVVEHLQEEIGKEKLVIRLNPEKLGQVEILFQAQGDQLNITMSSSGQEAEQAIREGARELAETIAEKSPRWNLVDIRVENRGQDQQNKQESRQEERREKSNQGQHQKHEGRRSQGDHKQETGASEWAAFHLGG